MSLYSRIRHLEREHRRSRSRGLWRHELWPRKTYELTRQLDGFPEIQAQLEALLTRLEKAPECTDDFKALEGAVAPLLWQERTLRHNLLLWLGEVRGMATDPVQSGEDDNVRSSELCPVIHALSFWETGEWGPHWDEEGQLVDLRFVPIEQVFPNMGAVMDDLDHLY
jgi:hypothetical protein